MTREAYIKLLAQCAATIFSGDHNHTVETAIKVAARVVDRSSEIAAEAFEFSDPTSAPSPDEPPFETCLPTPPLTA